MRRRKVTLRLFTDHFCISAERGRHVYIWKVSPVVASGLSVGGFHSSLCPSSNVTAVQGSRHLGGQGKQQPGAVPRSDGPAHRRARVFLRDGELPCHRCILHQPGRLRSAQPAGRGVRVFQVDQSPLTYYRVYIWCLQGRSMSQGSCAEA